jgi:hypothetical protein
MTSSFPVRAATLIALLLLTACSGTPAKSTASAAVADNPEKSVCTDELVTGSLVQKHKVCTDSDRNRVSNDMQSLGRLSNTTR